MGNATSYNPLIVMGNLNVVGNIYAANPPNVSTFNIVITKSVLINSGQYYKYDLDLRPYTTSNTTFPFISVRKFKFVFISKRRTQFRFVHLKL